MAVRNRIVAATATILFVLVIGLLSLPQTRHAVFPIAKSHWPFATGAEKCNTDLAALEELNLTSVLEYRRRCVRATPSKHAQRTSVDYNERRLLPQRPEQIHLADPDDRVCKTALPACTDWININVPQNKTGVRHDTRSLVIGAATTLDRLNTSLPQMARWLANTQTRILIIVRDSSHHEDFVFAQTLADSLDIDATLLPNPFPEKGEEARVGQAVLHFAIVRELHNHYSTGNQWFAVIDDDTFFPSLSDLLDALAPYDPRKSWYIGALSEDWRAIRGFGHMAYGGAGAILSLPLLRTLYKHYDECLVPSHEGDVLYRNCVYRHTSPPVHLTQLPGLHQMDFFGDIAGWYESGINPLLSIHHYNGWHQFPVHHAHLVTAIAGSGAFLQRYAFADDVVLTNGFSIAQYPIGLDSIDLDRVERTFLEEERHMFDFSLGGLRRKLEEGLEKISWRLEYSSIGEGGIVRQFYVRRADNTDVEDDMRWEPDSVIELDWSK